MFRTFARKFLPNPFDWMLKRTAKRGGKKVLLAWNRGLGDIALGLYAMVQRIREVIPDAEITFLIRENLRDGFSLLEGIQVIVAPDWKRGEPVNVRATLQKLNIEPEKYDLLIEKPSPTDWVRWQRGKVVPRLKWKKEFDPLCDQFDLPQKYVYIGVQVSAETNYGLWRNWPLARWEEFFHRLDKWENARILLFGFGDSPRFCHSSLIDLRGKTTLFEMLSIIKNRCSSLVLPDSGVLSMAFYLDASFPIEVVSLWADPNHGILKQAVPSPNPQLVHHALIGAHRDLSTVSADAVLNAIFPKKPLQKCRSIGEIEKKKVERAACIILAGGQGTRLGTLGPKGLFSIEGKSLFQWICEKVPSKDLPLAIMTSPLNHEETVNYFQKHSFFGLDIQFFQQEMEPVLNDKRKQIEIRPGEIVKGPNGNGSLFRSFDRSGILDLFLKRGIDTVSIIPVENPLAIPFDPAFIAYHREEKSDATVKCIERREGDLSMGVLVERCGKIEILEYSEIGVEELRACEGGSLKYRYANSGQLVLDLLFMKQMASVELPVHWVQKKVQIGARSVPVWKGERFIFDAFAYAKRVKAISAPRETCYAPLKGRESIEAVELQLRKL